jgi:hypothetical protein
MGRLGTCRSTGRPGRHSPDRRDLPHAPYGQIADWQLRDHWQVRRLEPFTFGQVRPFVLAWYEQTCQTPQAKYTVEEASRRSEHLVTELYQRADLADMISLRCRAQRGIGGVARRC